MKVGAAIEEIDILDLQERLAETGTADTEWFYKSLLAGSENHLQAFVTNLKSQTGETYVPQYLSQAAYDAIVSVSGSQGGATGAEAVADRSNRITAPSKRAPCCRSGAGEGVKNASLNERGKSVYTEGV